MKRVLFVDDEPNILSGLRDLLHKYRSRMQMVFALGGQAALEELGKGSFDVIVSDMRMPGMDGPTLLRQVMNGYPDIVRIVLSGHADREAIFAALPVSHQFLAKPCDADTLCNVIERACRLKALLSNEVLRKQIGAVEKLPSATRTYDEMMAAMSLPNASVQTIAAIVEQDPAMSAKVLQLVNSACFGMTRTISGIDRAITYLGMDLIRNLATTVNIFSCVGQHSSYSQYALELIQEHALFTARIAKRLLKPPDLSQYAFTAALLHDVGKVVLSMCVPEYPEVLEKCKGSNRPLHEIETETLQVNHAEAGAYLLGLWGLPYPIVEAVAFHHNPLGSGERTFDIPSAVYVANVLVDRAFGKPTEFDCTFLDNLGLADQVPGWEAMADEEVFAHSGRSSKPQHRQPT